MKRNLNIRIEKQEDKKPKLVYIREKDKEWLREKFEEIMLEYEVVTILGHGTDSHNGQVWTNSTDRELNYAIDKIKKSII